MTTQKNTDGFLPEIALVSVDGIELETNKCTEIDFLEGEVIGSSLEILGRIKITVNAGTLFGLK